MTVETTNRFDKAYARLAVREKNLVDDALRTFVKNPFEASLHNHGLKGKHKGLHSISVGYDLRIIFTQEGGHVIVIQLDVGSHDEVY